MWKGFYVWRKYCVRRKFRIAQEALKQNLFILNPVLQKALLSIQAMCCKLVDMSFTDLSKMEENTLSEFMEVQVCFSTGFVLLYCLYIYSETSIYRSRIIVFPDPSFNFYGPWANPISTMAPASIGFPDPLFLFQTPDENDE
jgi:hypothetical protein